MSSVRRIVTIVIVTLACGALLSFGGRSSLALRSQSHTSKQTPTPDETSTPGVNFAIDDPLKDNSQGNQWTENDLCQFIDGAYDAGVKKANTVHFCLSKKRSFSNFDYIVQMKIVKGDCGGLAFRELPDSGYVFEVCQDRSYTLYKKDASSGLSKLTGGTSSSIHTGLDQTNLIGVEARGNQLDFYINSTNTPIDSTSDDTSGQGLVGVVASSNNSPTIVAYTDAKVADLSVP